MHDALTSHRFAAESGSRLVSSKKPKIQNPTIYAVFLDDPMGRDGVAILGVARKGLGSLAAKPQSEIRVSGHCYFQ